MPKYYWNDLVKWGHRIGKRYDGVIYDNVTERYWDWGQALCRELYGVDWMTHPEFLAADNEMYPPTEAVERALSWEAGNWPEWAELDSQYKAWAIK